MPDARLARLAARGSEAAFGVIFERHHQALHRYCHSIVGNAHDASDALQSTMLKAYRALSGETRDITLRPWLYKIAHNESISLLRARRSDSDLESAAHVGDPATEGLIESRDRLRSLAVDLTELTEQGRGALLMRELGGLDFAEIAVALGISPAAAKQSVYESRCVLQALQEGREMDCDVVRRTLSDGDRRMLRGKRLRGHLRSCAGCHDFERALRERPAQLAAIAPPLPLAAAAAMLSGVVGAGAGAGGGFGTGGGLLAGLTAGTKAIAGASLATKVATVAVVGTTIVGGGAVVVTPDRAADARPAPPAAVAGPASDASAGGLAGAAPARLSPAHAPTRAGEAALAGETGAAADIAAKARGGESAGAGPARGASRAARAPGRSISAAARARRGRSATTPGGGRDRGAVARARSGQARDTAASRATSRSETTAVTRARAKRDAASGSGPSGPSVGTGRTAAPAAGAAATATPPPAARAGGTAPRAPR